MSYSEAQSPQAVNNILSSIRQMISEEDSPALESTQKTNSPIKADSESNISQDQVLELTRLIREDGSVVELNPQNESKGTYAPEPSQKAVKHNPFSNSPSTFSESSKQEKLMEKNADFEPTFSVKPQAHVNEEGSYGSYSPQTYGQPYTQSQYQFQPQEAPVNSSKGNTFQPTSFVDSTQNNLMSADTLQESAAAFASLSRATEKRVPHENKNPTAETIASYTVDNLMRELLRPLLKEWIDAHLPSLVKTLVLEQIEKVLKQQGTKTSL